MEVRPAYEMRGYTVQKLLVHKPGRGVVVAPEEVSSPRRSSSGPSQEPIDFGESGERQKSREGSSTRTPRHSHGERGAAVLLVVVVVVVVGRAMYVLVWRFCQARRENSIKILQAGGILRERGQNNGMLCWPASG